MGLEIPPHLINALLYEGSDLFIQRANSDNLDWNWRVTYCNGKTGQSVTRTGTWLHDTLRSIDPS